MERFQYLMEQKVCAHAAFGFMYLTGGLCVALLDVGSIAVEPEAIADWYSPLRMLSRAAFSRDSCMCIVGCAW